MYYAQLNENDICIGVSQLGGEVDEVGLVAIESYDETLLGKRHNTETGAFEDVPQPTPEPETDPTIDEQVASLKQDNLILMDALATTFEELLMLREELAGGEV